jgi:hypothetical protein
VGRVEEAAVRVAEGVSGLAVLEPVGARVLPAEVVVRGGQGEPQPGARVQRFGLADVRAKAAGELGRVRPPVAPHGFPAHVYLEEIERQPVPQPPRAVGHARHVPGVDVLVAVVPAAPAERRLAVRAPARVLGETAEQRRQRLLVRADDQGDFLAGAAFARRERDVAHLGNDGDAHRTVFHATMETHVGLDADRAERPAARAEVGVQGHEVAERA